MRALTKIHISLRLSHVWATSEARARSRTPHKAKWIECGAATAKQFGAKKKKWREKTIYSLKHVYGSAALVSTLDWKIGLPPSLSRSLARLLSPRLATHLHWFCIYLFLLSSCMSRFLLRFTFQLSFIHLTNQPHFLRTQTDWLLCAPRHTPLDQSEWTLLFVFLTSICCHIKWQKIWIRCLVVGGASALAMLVTHEQVKTPVI